MSDLLESPAEVRTAMLAWLNRRWSTSRSFQMVPFLRALQRAGSEPYTEPFIPTIDTQDVERICSATWGAMKPREKEDLWRELWERFGAEAYGLPKDNLPPMWWDPLGPPEEQPPSVRQRLEESRAELDWRREARRTLERLQAMGYSEAELKTVWNDWLRSMNVTDGLDEDQVSAFYMIFDAEFQNLIAPSA
jgi:hypothetical protein